MVAVDAASVRQDPERHTKDSVRHPHGEYEQDDELEPVGFHEAVPVVWQECLVEDRVTRLFHGGQCRRECREKCRLRTAAAGRRQGRE